MKTPILMAPALCLGLACFAMACTEPPGQPEDASGLDASSDADASMPVPDAASDASGLPIVTQHDFCALPWFKLPVDGPSQQTDGIRMSGDRVVFARSHLGDEGLNHEIHLFDIQRCNDYQLTLGEEAYYPFISDNEIVWMDYNFPDRQSGADCSDLILMSSSEWVPRSVPVPGCFEIQPQLTPTHFFYRSQENSDIYTKSSFVQLDRATQEVTELAPPEALVESFELSDRYLVWAAYVQDSDPESQGRTVLYKDLDSGEVTVVEASKPRLQYHVRTHGELILWEGGDVYLEPPSHLMLYHIPTGDSTIITELEGTNPLGDVHGRVVALSTTHYRTDGQLTFWPSDVALYDIDSGIMRRVTVQSGYLRAIRLSDRHLIVGELTGPSPQSWNWYVLDLHQLGLVDETGHVLEGWPVFDPSEPPGSP